MRKDALMASRKRRTSKGNPPGSVDEYLDRLAPLTRAALAKLRRTIKLAAPHAAEVISYQIPTYRHGGPLVAFAAFGSHCGFYVMSPRVMRAHRAELQGYDTGKATIRFGADTPLPAALVRRLVKARLAENKASADG